MKKNSMFERYSTIEDYKRVYDEVVSLSFDADGFGLFEEISEEDVERAKWFYMIMEVLNDVPMSRVEHVFEQKGLDPDAVEEEMLERIYGKDDIISPEMFPEEQMEGWWQSLEMMFEDAGLMKADGSYMTKEELGNLTDEEVLAYCIEIFGRDNVKPY